MTKPADLFIGLVDFFSILLPGGLFSFFLFGNYPSLLNGLAPIDPKYQWLAFLFLAYLSGHLIFMLGSKLDALYNQHRKRKNPYSNESAFQCATDIKQQQLSEPQSKAVNTYQWSVSVLTTQHPEAMLEVNRLVADAKFFRSLVIALPIIAALCLGASQLVQAAIALLLIAPCYFRYYDRRLKSTTRAYQYIVTLYGLKKL